MEETLHFARVRDREMPKFLDPEADLKAVFVQAISAVLSAMDSCEQCAAAVKQLDSVFNVLTTRLLEDPAPLAAQLRAFAEAYRRIVPDARRLFEAVFFRFILALFALFMRRDGKVDNASSHRLGVSSAALFAAMLHGVPDIVPLIGRAVDEVYSAVVAADVRPAINVDAAAETVTIRAIKDRAFRLLGASHSMPWEELARLCDEYCVLGKGSQEDQVAVALAFPDYAHPYTNVTVQKEENDDTK